MKDHSTIKILDIPFTTLNSSEIINYLEDNFQLPDPKQIFLATPNPEMLLETQKNPEFKSILQNTSLNLPDGNGIIWANYYLEKSKNHSNKIWLTVYGLISLVEFAFLKKSTKKLFQKAIHGSDFTLEIAKSPLAKQGIFLLGNHAGLKKDSAESTANKLAKKYPHLKISGYSDTILTDNSIVEKINQSEAKILLIGFGAPAQEKWLSKNLPELKNIKIAMGVGGTFDFISGTLPRAPQLMRSIGLEWIYRLYKQPKRIKRIFNALVVFSIQIIKKRLQNN